MTGNKRVFITVFHSFIQKNILNTEALSVIKKYPESEIYLLVPELKKVFFEELYADSCTHVIGVGGNFLNRGLVRVFSRLSKLLINSHYLWYKKQESFERHKTIIYFLKYHFELLFTDIFSERKIVRKLIRILFLKLVRVPEIENIFEKYSPDLVFSTDIFDEYDQIVAGEAKRRKTPLVGMIRSWDNCYSKGVLRVLPDKMLVNNNTLAEEVVDLHDMPIERVRIVGSPQHDIFVNEKRSSREEFCRRAGLNPNSPYILFAPAGTILSDTDGHIVKIFLNAREEGEIPADVQLLIRNHPNHPADLSEFENATGVIVEHPGKVFNVKNPKDTELTQSDNQYLADSLYYCAMVIFVATTLGLDATVFDKSQIAIDFDGFVSKPYHQSVKRYHNEDHMRKMLDCGGVCIVETRDDLVSAINTYLKDPTLDREGRDRIRDQQFYKLDGLAGERVGKFIVDQMKSIRASS